MSYCETRFKGIQNTKQLDSLENQQEINWNLRPAIHCRSIFMIIVFSKAVRHKDLNKNTGNENKLTAGNEEKGSSQRAVWEHMNQVTQYKPRPKHSNDPLRATPQTLKWPGTGHAPFVHSPSHKISALSPALGTLQIMAFCSLIMYAPAYKHQPIICHSQDAKKKKKTISECIMIFQPPPQAHCFPLCFHLLIQGCSHKSKTLLLSSSTTGRFGTRFPITEHPEDI